MKGLLIKDIRLLKNQGKTLFVLLGLMIAITLVLGGSSPMPCSYIIFILSVMGINTISFDEYNNGMPFLFVLPVTKKQYVHEKYLFTLGVLVGSGVIGILVSVALWALGNGEGGVRDILMTCGACMAVSAVFLGVAFPLKFRFEGEKGRMILPVVFGLGWVLFIFLIKGAEKLSGDVWNQVYEMADRLGTAGIIAVLAAVVILFFGASWMISLKIIEKREF